MALINCQECGKQMSDQAATCPSCGFHRKAKEIEQTGKKWKGMQILGMLLIVFSIFPCVASASGGGEPGAGMTLGILCMLAGFILYLGARMGAWWNHG